MLDGLFRSLGKRKALTDPAPSGRVWAIGDVHGCLDLLQGLLRRIQAVQPANEPTRVVFLGDYVDRGPDSRGVLDALIAFAARTDTHAEFIRGNHDHVMQSFLADSAVGPAWHAMGAAATLASYGVASPVDPASPDGWPAVRVALQACIPREHLGFLARLRPSVESGDYFFTHAGVRPGRPLAKQKVTDLMWVRNAFLQDPRPLEKIIVHGHTPTASPYSDDRRVGIDTGAYASGALTGVLLEGTRRSFVQARRHPSFEAQIYIDDNVASAKV